MTRTSILLAVLALASAAKGEDILQCIIDGQKGCLEFQFGRILQKAEIIPNLRITRHLTLVRTQKDSENEVNTEEPLLERLERYLYSHGLRLELPQELVDGARGLVSTEYLESLPQEITLPLARQDENQGRGFIKKIVLPFLLGLKFKATAVIPIAMALIALKTWKALTLGLLSIVLSAALVIFKLTRPKVHNYEIYYPPSHHIISDHPHYDHHARSYADSLAYSAYY